jgi:hypothetical protein
MAHNFSRPTLPYQYESRPNNNRYQVLTKALDEPVDDITLDTDFNYLVDSLNQLDTDIQGVVAGNIPGSDNPDNANFVVTLDGNGNLPLKLISDENCEVNSIDGNKLIPQSVTREQLQDNCINASKIESQAVTRFKLANLSVSTNKLDDFAVTSEKLDDLAVTTGKLESLSVTTAKLANLSVSTGKLVDLSVTTGKLADLSVTTLKLADLSVSTGKLVDLSVTTGKLADLSVTAAKIANNTITFTQISDSFAATQSQQQSASSSSVFVSPATQQYHPSADKFKCTFDGTATGTNSPLFGYNVTSIVRENIGRYKVNYTNPVNADAPVFPSVMSSVPRVALVTETASTYCRIAVKIPANDTYSDVDRIFMSGG